MRMKLEEQDRAIWEASAGAKRRQHRARQIYFSLLTLFHRLLRGVTPPYNPLGSSECQANVPLEQPAGSVSSSLCFASFLLYLTTHMFLFRQQHVVVAPGSAF